MIPRFYLVELSFHGEAQRLFGSEPKFLLDSPFPYREDPDAPRRFYTDHSGLPGLISSTVEYALKDALKAVMPAKLGIRHMLQNGLSVEACDETGVPLTPHSGVLSLYRKGGEGKELPVQAADGIMERAASKGRVVKAEYVQDVFLHFRITAPFPEGDILRAMPVFPAFLGGHQGRVGAICQIERCESLN
jgi:hypothetical protein